MLQRIIATAAAGAALAVMFYRLFKVRLPSTLAGDIAALDCRGRPFAPVMPTRLELNAGATSEGGMLRVGPIVIQRASFKALWIRVGSLRQPAPASALLEGVVREALASQTALKPMKAALYVAICEDCLGSGSVVDVGMLCSCGFVFHHYRPSEHPATGGEWVYVADLAKMVPHYATSVEGATGVVFSPDELSVLAVWERGGWNTPGGAIDLGEMKVDGLKREIREEVGVTLDDAFPPVYLGGYQMSRARDGTINDNFSAFAVRAASEQTHLDNKEIHCAFWLRWRVLLDEWVAAGRPSIQKNVALTSAELPVDKKLVSINLLRWLDTYRSSKGMVCKITPGKEVKIGA